MIVIEEVICHSSQQEGIHHNTQGHMLKLQASQGGRKSEGKAMAKPLLGFLQEGMERQEKQI
jgi:hypothetical protein